MSMLINFFILMFIFLNSSCASIQKQINLPTTVISASPYFISKELIQSSGANFFNDEEQFDRLLNAKRMGIKWIRLSPSKWKSSLYPNEKGTFLVGKRDEYRGLIEDDLKELIKVLDWAYYLDIKVMLTFLTLPGRIFAQHNGGVQDNRIWQSEKWQSLAVQFIHDVALHVGAHPALFAINPINEPSPEKTEPRLLDWYKDDYGTWAKKIENTPQDLNRFYERVVANIRKNRSYLPIVLDVGFHAHPWAFKILKPHEDPHVWYSFHWYEPFVYSQSALNYSYPGQAPIGEKPANNEQVYWDKTTIKNFLKPVIDWQREYKIDYSKIVVGEFGVNRLINGAANYLRDCRSIFLEYGFMHAFYQFREPSFPRMDYELGVEDKIWPYWQALEKGVSPNYEKLRKSEFLEPLGISPIRLQKPLRGFNSWNSFGGNIDEKIIKEIMNAMKSKGLLDIGFDTIIIDGGWRQEKLSSLNLLQSDENKFPSGMATLANYAHNNGFKLGLHIPVGTRDCGNKTKGTFGFEKENAEQINKWGIDLIKLDQCLLDNSEEWPDEVLFNTYESWANHIDGKNIKVMASAQRFRSWYPNFSYGRTTQDLRPKIFGGAIFDEPFVGDFLTVVQAARQNSKLFALSSNTYTNDPDMLVLENGLSKVEDKSHFSMWAMMGAPLILGNDPRNMSEHALNLLKNHTLLSIQEDPVEQGRLILDDGDLMIWRKHLKNGDTAFLFVNLKKNGILKRSFSYKDLNLLAPRELKSAFSKQYQMKNKKGLDISLNPHDCELLIFIN